MDVKGFIQSAVEGASRAGKTGLLKAKKISPTLMVVGGIACIGIGIYEACKATHDQYDDIIDEHIDKVDEIRAQVSTEEISVRESKTLAAKQTVKSCWKLAKAYSKATGCITVGVFLILISHGEMNKRLAGAIAYGESVNQLLGDYRHRVKEKYGDEEDVNLLTGRTQKYIDVEEVNERGEKIYRQEKVDIFEDYGKISMIVRNFDSEQNKLNWRRDSFSNKAFVEAWIKCMEGKLNRDGYISMSKILEEGGWDVDGSSYVLGYLVDRDEDGKPMYTKLPIDVIEFDDAVCNASGHPYKSYRLVFNNLKVIVYDI